ncbi:MFS transporter [Lacibacter sediminis]|uniref:MFS transporter n=1 Tax=Lacibacter sediminis TaxID=2760713 RepID=A0A7G5XG89_9BACT|nr:MFS transporter [Lacibacter sediminis]QNA44492.1 MFS transporter [Lacibacter sediminis]
MLSKTFNSYKQAYTGLSKETWLLSWIMLVNRSGTMVVPFLSLYLTSPAMGYSLSQAGFVFGLFGAGAFTGAYIGGRLTDKIGFYKIQLITLLGGGLLFMVLGQMKSYPLICIFTFVLSFVNEAFRPANSTAIAFYSNEENRTRSYSLNRLAINLGWAIGSGLGGLIAHVNYELLFWIDGITNISAALLLYQLLKPPLQERKKETVAAATVKILSAYKDKVYLWFIFCSFLFAASFFQLFTNLSVYFKKERGFSEPFIGFLMAANGIFIVLTEMALIYRLEKRKTPLLFVVLGVLLTAIAFLLLNFLNITHLMAMVIILFITVGEMLSMPFMNSFWISRSNHSNRGQYAALYTMAWSAAQTFGPMFGARIADHSGFNVLWWIVGTVCMLSVIGFNLLRKQQTVVESEALNQQEKIMEDEVAAAQDIAG